MTRVSKRVILLVAVLILSGAAGYYRAQTAPDLVTATNAFLASLTPEQAAKARFDFNDDERFNWHFIPIDRKGLPFKEMQTPQRLLAHAMMAAALGHRGYVKAATVMSLEQILLDTERGSGPVRDPERYFFSIFGEPSTAGVWGWRVEGHHVAVNVTMNKGKLIAWSPTFLGANPAEVKTGPRKGLRALAGEEDLARELLASLDPSQKKTAIIEAKAPGDIVTGDKREAQVGDPVGLSAAKMSPKQKEGLLALIREYAERNAPESAAATMKEITPAVDKVYFAWAGPEQRGQGHYYRVHGSTFLIEYDNTQNQANHIHSVWRDFKNDFGVDVLREHYRTAHLQ